MPSNKHSNKIQLNSYKSISCISVRYTGALHPFSVKPNLLAVTLVPCRETGSCVSVVFVKWLLCTAESAGIGPNIYDRVVAMNKTHAFIHYPFNRDSTDWLD